MRLRTLLASVSALALLSGPAAAQGVGGAGIGGGSPGSAALTPKGNLTPGHCLTAFSQSQVQDAGSECSGVFGPAGNSGDIQYNNSGSFGGVAVVPSTKGGTGVNNGSNTLTVQTPTTLPIAPGGTQCLHMSTGGAITTTGTDCAIASGFLRTDAANPALPWNFTGVSGAGWQFFNYGSCGLNGPGAVCPGGSPLPVNPEFGYSALQANVWGTPGAGTNDPITCAICGNTHLSAGTRGLAVGGLFQSFNDGTWSPIPLTTTGNTHSNTTLDSLASVSGIQPGLYVIGSGIVPGTYVVSVDTSSVVLSQAATATATGVSVSFKSINAGNAAVWGQAFTSRGGQMYGGEFLAGATDTNGAGINGVEIDTNATSDVTNKFGLAINSDAADTGAVTGTGTVFGSGATYTASAYILMQSANAAPTYKYGWLSVKATDGNALLPSDGALMRFGGYSTGHIIDASDLTCTVACLDLTGLIRQQTVLTGSSTTDFLALQNNGAVDAATLRIAQRQYTGADQSSIDFIANSNSNFKASVSIKTNFGSGLAEAVLFDNDQSTKFGGHIRTGSAAPVLSACGTSPAISGSDTAGEVTMGTDTPTGCTITFNFAYTSAPYCTVTWQASPMASQSYAVTNTAITLTQTATSSNKANYNCVGRSGG